MNLRQEITRRLHTLPEVANWPEVATLISQSEKEPNNDWIIPLRTCAAVGGNPDDALPAAVALACLQQSIIIADDLLDEDPRGLHHRWGIGAAANFALALQAAPFRLLNTFNVDDARRLAISDCLGHIALATATGQKLDVDNLQGEENYWRVVRAKSTPFYGGAYKLGAIIGGAPAGVTERFYDLGVLIGEIIQIEDDFDDAMERPANADWRQGRNNLLLLYARTTKHELSERFETLLPDIDVDLKLQEAQQILVKCGAASYAAFLLVEKYRNVRNIVADLKLVDPQPVTEMLDLYERVLLRLLRISGSPVPEGLLQHIS